jgi:hypothetical protein
VNGGRNYDGQIRAVFKDNFLLESPSSFSFKKKERQSAGNYIRFTQNFNILKNKNSFFRDYWLSNFNQKII